MAAFGDVGLPDPHLVVRCARHYERAAAILVSAAVATASMFVEPPPVAWLIGEWIGEVVFVTMLQYGCCRDNSCGTCVASFLS